jgi:hypothetical protein
MEVVEFTDAAADMADIIRAFRHYRADRQPAWQGFQGATGVPSQQFWDLCSVMMSRLGKLRQLVKQIDDPDFKPAQRKAALEAIERFSNAFLPTHFGTNWTEHVGNYIREEDATAFEWLSIVTRRHQPLRKLTEEQRMTLVARIDDVVSSLDADIELAAWAKQPLADGLGRLRFVLEHLLFFGCDTAIAALAIVHRDAMAIEAAIFEADETKTRGKTRPPGLMQVLNFVALAVTLFNAPDQVATAFERYKGWTLDYIARHHASPRLTQQLYLAPPKPSDHPTQDTDISSSSAIKPEEPREVDEPTAM